MTEQRDDCRALLERHATEIAAAPGSSHNHQAWPGGYLDQCKLDAAGALHCFGWTNNDLTDTINRYSTTEPPVVEYDETGQVVQIHISTLVTGPSSTTA